MDPQVEVVGVIEHLEQAPASRADEGFPVSKRFTMDNSLDEVQDRV
jgi:hypothetical protein